MGQNFVNDLLIYLASSMAGVCRKLRLMDGSLNDSFFAHMRHLEIIIIKFHVPRTYCADPHAGCCGSWGLKISGYTIMFWGDQRLNHLIIGTLA